MEENEEQEDGKTCFRDHCVGFQWAGVGGVHFNRYSFGDSTSKTPGLCCSWVKPVAQKGAGHALRGQGWALSSSQQAATPCRDCGVPAWGGKASGLASVCLEPVFSPLCPKALGPLLSSWWTPSFCPHNSWLPCHASQLCPLPIGHPFTPRGAGGAHLPLRPTHASPLSTLCICSSAFSPVDENTCHCGWGVPAVCILCLLCKCPHVHSPTLSPRHRWGAGRGGNHSPRQSGAGTEALRRACGLLKAAQIRGSRTHRTVHTAATQIFICGSRGETALLQSMSLI